MTTPRRPLRPEELFDEALKLRERAEKAEANLRAAIEIAEEIQKCHDCRPDLLPELRQLKTTLCTERNEPRLQNLDTCRQVSVESNGPTA